MPSQRDIASGLAKNGSCHGSGVVPAPAESRLAFFDVYAAHVRTNPSFGIVDGNARHPCTRHASPPTPRLRAAPGSSPSGRRSDCQRIQRRSSVTRRSDRCTARFAARVRRGLSRQPRRPWSDRLVRFAFHGRVLAGGSLQRRRWRRRGDCRILTAILVSDYRLMFLGTDEE